MTINPFFRFSAVALAGALMFGAAQAADLDVQDAWARATVPGQQSSAVFARLTAPEAVELVGGESPVAEVTEIHEMAMDGDVMKMRAIKGLELPVGETVELTPGGYHVMLMGLKAPLVKDSVIAVTLKIRDAKGNISEQTIKAEVRDGTGGVGHKAHDRHLHEDTHAH